MNGQQKMSKEEIFQTCRILVLVLNKLSEERKVRFLTYKEEVLLKEVNLAFEKIQDKLKNCNMLT